MFFTSQFSLILKPPSLPVKRRIRAPAIRGQARDGGQRHLPLQANIPPWSLVHEHEAFSGIRSCLKIPSSPHTMGEMLPGLCWQRGAGLLLRTSSTLGLQGDLLQAGTSRRSVASCHTGCCSITPAWDFSPSLPVLVRFAAVSKESFSALPLPHPFSLIFSPRECLGKC